MASETIDGQFHNSCSRPSITKGVDKGCPSQIISKPQRNGRKMRDGNWLTRDHWFLAVFGGIESMAFNDMPQRVCFNPEGIGSFSPRLARLGDGRARRSARAAPVNRTGQDNGNRR